MKVYFFENRKLKYFTIGDDVYTVDYKKKKIYITRDGACFSPISFQKLKIKKDRIYIYCDKIELNFDWQWGRT